MRSLFPSPTVAPLPEIQGLAYHADYLTPDDERSLAAEIDGGVWDQTWARRRQIFGGGYGSGESVQPIPKWGIKLLDRLESLHLLAAPFDHMLVNEYEPGQGIALHRDYDPFDRVVVSISLLSACVMDLRRVRDQHHESLLLEPRSLLVLGDEARYEWEHGIARRKTDVWEGKRISRNRRLSITFRRRT
jgi:hypothetical protein